MLIPLRSENLDMILKWRNHPDVRKNSFNDKVISKEEHYRWWDKTRNDAAKRWLLFHDEGKDIGVVNYYDIDNVSAYWGFYLSDKLTNEDRLRYWILIEQQAPQYAFEVLGVSVLRCEVLEFNKATLLMHKRFGYAEKERYSHLRGEVAVLELHKVDVSNAR